MPRCLFLVVPVLWLVFVQPVMAHPGHGGHDFVDGWQHPLHGLDHLLAMVAVGLLAVRMGGRAVWIMPGIFILSMMAGGLIALLGVPLPGVEYGITASVLVLGLLIAVTRVVPLGMGAILVALFALFHGYAHAAEMPIGSSLGVYAAGFLLATSLLQLAGVVVGLLLTRKANGLALRFSGALISLAGALLIFGAL